MVQQTHFHLHHYNYNHSMDQQHRHQLPHHHHHHDRHHASPTLRSKHRWTSTVSMCVLLTACLTWWFDIVNVSKYYHLMNPRKLTTDTAQQTSSRRQASLGRAVLLRSDVRDESSSFVEPWKQVHDQKSTPGTATNQSSQQPERQTWNHRIVYLPDDSSWRDGPTKRNYSISIYPRIIPPGQERGTFQDDEVEPESMQDFTRWYPQIDSQDNEQDFHIERKIWPTHEIDAQHCRPMHAWQSTSFPVCNTIHEKNMQASVVDNDLYLISKKGFWRQAWGSNDIVVNANTTTKTTTAPQTMVWKTFKIQHSMEDAFFENNRVDALAMERLTASPHVINIYGFCSMTVIQEYAGRQIHEQKLDDPVTSLDIAIQVARGIRDIHYIDDSPLPALVHNDINLANIIVTEDGRPVLNDFNIAVLMMKNDSVDDSAASACPFYARFPNPQWRSPEEQVESEEESRDDPPIVNEKIDIYALGNVLYRLIAGGSPWKKKGFPKLTAEEKMQVAVAKRYNGTLPPIPSHISLDNHPASLAMYQAMQMCYRFNPNQRPTAKQVVAFLEEARSKLS